jgi:predicted amidophosphoribosyltransferase
VAGGTVAHVIGRILDVLFPRSCVGCGGRGWPFCLACRAEIAWLDPPGCERCGRPFDRSVDACRDCPPPSLARARAPFLYAGPVRRALMRLKFSGAMSVATALAAPMAALLEDDPSFVTPNGERNERGPVLTWVPLGRRRRRARSFDQAEALARAVGDLSGLPVARLLKRVVETNPQARRSGEERRLALQGAFEAVTWAPATVLLVDDVLTSGSTAAACAEALRSAGARNVTALTAARSLGGRLPARCYNRPCSGLGLWLPGGVPPGSRCQPQAKRPT